jgi:hypothetical protein
VKLTLDTHRNAKYLTQDPAPRKTLQRSTESLCAKTKVMPLPKVTGA